MAAAPITPEFQAKAPQIMRYLMQHVTPRLSDEDAAAILGSFGVETGGFTLREEAGGGGGYGWAQWTGSRRDDMEVWCEANNYNPYADAESEYDRACCAFFIHEIIETWEKRVLTAGGTINGVFYPQLNKCATLDEKTESFWRLFERPGTPHADWRREMAHEALRVYRGSEGEAVMPYQSIAISSGHSTKCQGAVGFINEVKEATRVVNRTAEFLRARGVNVMTFHDTVSTNSNDNLNRIVDWHNSQTRQLDVSVHFNSYDTGTQGNTTGEPKGVEVLWVTQEKLASDISAAIAKAGSLKDRGEKYNSGLFVLNNTDMPCVLLEICFVNSSADVQAFQEHFDAICDAIASVLSGGAEAAVPPARPDRPARPTRPPPTEPAPIPQIHIEVAGEVLVFVNGEQVGTQG